MKQRKNIYLLNDNLPAIEIGNKALSLLYLRKHHFRIPHSYLLSARAFEEFQKGKDDIINQLKKEISALPEANYAIRSSTSLEDTEKYSFAGQFQTITNVRGPDNILRAVQEVWKSASAITGSEYSLKTAGASPGIRCAVIIQNMVPALLSGVGFSKNPVTHTTEVVIEAVEGEGDNLVQKGITPLRWRILNGKILEGSNNFHSFQIIQKIAEDLIVLKRKTGIHVDIEWAYDGYDIYYLQLRNITGDKNLPLYSNKLAQEMLPGQIKPLVWSVNIPLVNGTWIQLLSEITGRLNIEPEKLARPFYYRAYFNMAALGEIFHEFGLPPESLESMMGHSNEKGMMKFKPGIRTLRHTSRIIRFLHSKLNFEKVFLREYGILKNQYDMLAERITHDFSVRSFSEIYRELFEGGRRIAYLNIVVPLLMQFYNRRLTKKLKKIGVDYESLNFNEDFPDLNELSPIPDMEKIRRKLDLLPPDIQQQCNTLQSLSDQDGTMGIIEEFNELLKRYGHLSESGNDFSVPKWNENPEQVFTMIHATTPQGHAKNTITFDQVQYSKFKYPGLRSLYQKSGKFRVYREQISSLYIYGYGQFRSLFLRLGDALVNVGIINERSDIFYLTINEINGILSLLPGNNDSFQQTVEDRKTEMDLTKELLLPSLIYGDEAPILSRGKNKNFPGVGTSTGTYRGSTKIVRSVNDFKDVKTGEVIIIPFSDVSWTPILVKAGAIVSESGGILSHCSIIARELGIPALVSVENACSLRDGLMVTVDGSNGLLTIHDDE